MTSITSARWENIRNLSEGHGMCAELVDSLIPNCLIGVDGEGLLHFMIAVGDEAFDLPPELEAVSVRVMEADRIYLDVYAKGHYEMIFTPLANQIFFGIAVQGRKPIDAVSDTLDEFRNALKPVRPDISLGEQIGLFGELWILKNVLIPSIGARACYMWSGPAAERHDFVGTAVHIEVKTTTRSQDKHEISRIDQLRAPRGKKLLLASIQLERTDGGEFTIADLIDEIILALGEDGKAIDEFESRLALLQWHDSLRQSSSLKRFNLRDVNFFEVDGTFPRLPDDYVPPRGIVALRYTIDISSRPVMDRECVGEFITAL